VPRVKPAVTFVVISDRPKALPVLLHSLINQTREDWECIVLDQSESDKVAVAMSDNSLLVDSRVWHVRVERRGDWGYAERDRIARRDTSSPVLCFPCDDAYYAPPFVEAMLAPFAQGCALTYCDWIFDKFGYVSYTGAPQVGWVDVGGFMVSREAYLDVGGFPAHDGDLSTAEGQLVERVVATKRFRHRRVPHHLYVKN
jgi:glycosyltransferase involved in cell wall biosynthesis